MSNLQALVDFTLQLQWSLLKQCEVDQTHRQHLPPQVPFNINAPRPQLLSKLVSVIIPQQLVGAEIIINSFNMIEDIIIIIDVQAPTKPRFSHDPLILLSSELQIQILHIEFGTPTNFGRI